MTHDALEQAPLQDQVALWIDEIAEGVGGHAFSSARLMERHRRYFARRVHAFAETPGDTSWWGECPKCGGVMAIDGLTGWWCCAGCFRRGEAYTLEYMLFGRQEPARWDACQRAADWLMSGRDGDTLRVAA